eukprot:CAMPEP_0206148728 /NCGR_PEP_ID=MMETSP1473-20131121/37406_1 /ASSEMBLY_ACC=CAM_ASM_001109 /TAXON_ID=1461547 /ORGANISM="Stichococcus sp, Strain RCC1054" /LENGTH=166 /DNA_ID=CAMNT_0053546151 /DNA_START=81 /DNA_END=581 /DNA_ORIENTATION=+
MATTMQGSLLNVSRPVFTQVRSFRAGVSPALPLRMPLRSMVTVAKATDNRYGTRNAARDANEAADDAAADATESINKFFDDLGTKWEENDEKPTTVILALSAFVALWAASGLLDSVNRLPLAGGFFEVVGLGVTGWFVYRWGATAEDRNELKREIDSFLNKVGISK